jgi:CBS domain-containing protein
MGKLPHITVHLQVMGKHRDGRAQRTAMVLQNVNQLPVVQDGRLVGVLSREETMRSLQIREEYS